jgi:hypothetical protein
MLARVWELQHRGVLHVHPVMAFGTPAQKAAVRRYVARLRELAPRYGFGHVDAHFQVVTAGAAAAYLSAYFVTGRKEKAALHQSVTAPEMPRSIIHVSNRLTQETRCTMRELRFRRFVFQVARSWVESGEVRVARAIALHALEHGEPARGAELKAIIRANENPDPDDACGGRDAPLPSASNSGGRISPRHA